MMLPHLHRTSLPDKLDFFWAFQSTDSLMALHHARSVYAVYFLFYFFTSHSHQYHAFVIFLYHIMADLCNCLSAIRVKIALDILNPDRR